jgi:hypothetical protein
MTQHADPPRAANQRNKLACGDDDHPEPPAPHPDDPNEKILEYFLAYFAYLYRLPLDSLAIQTLDLKFTGTGTDLYYATNLELEEYLGNPGAGLCMFYRLQRTRYSHVKSRYAQI